MREFIFRTVAPASLASVLLVLPSGWQSASGRDFIPGHACTQRHGDCVGRCIMTRYPTSPAQQDGCIQRTCDKQYDNCVKAEGGKGNRPQGGSGTTGPKGGGVAKDPTSPPKSGPWTGPPKSGTWHGPASQPLPKSGTWAGPASPPKSGPVWNGPATPPKGLDGGGPILKSGGAKR
jgi:hypothetical protein